MRVAGLFLCLLLVITIPRLLSSRPDTDGIQRALNAFQKSHSPFLQINFTRLYGGSGQFRVLHPVLEARRLNLGSTPPSCTGLDSSALPADDVTCGGPRWEFPGEREAIDKRQVLEGFLRGESELPDAFLKTPPFVDDSGHSYAYFLSQKDLPPFDDRRWVEDNLSFFKAGELSEILAKYHIDRPEFAVIAHLSESEMGDVVRGEPLVLTKNHLLVKNQSRLGFSPLEYDVYEARDWRAELKNIADGRKFSLVIWALTGLALLALLLLYFRQLVAKNRDQEKHRLALQVLSHEFRTPVSVMLLLLEELTQNQSGWRPSEQDLVTRMGTEVFRLQRIIEVSKNYLQAGGAKIPFNETTIPSINDWISDFVAALGQPVQCRLLEYDRSLRADPFWLKFVLGNLVQNAFAHGRQPVTLFLESRSEKLSITVQDEGSCEFAALSEMAEPFVKSPRSDGMGLGLNICRRIVEAWGGTVRFSSQPTRFTFSLGEGL